MNAALRRIEARLRELAKGVAKNTPATAGEAETLVHELRILAAQTGAQAEQIELGLVGGD